MSKITDTKVTEVAASLTKTIEAGAELFRCVLNTWEAINAERAVGATEKENPAGVTYSPTYEWLNPPSAEDFKRNLKHSLGDHSRSASR